MKIPNKALSRDSPVSASFSYDSGVVFLLRMTPDSYIFFSLSLSNEASNEIHTIENEIIFM